MNDLDFTGTNFDAYTVGELFALTRGPDWGKGGVNDGTDFFRPNIPTADLMKLTEVGKSLLYEAICLADEQGNDEYFEEAFSLYGPTIYGVIEELNLRDRNTVTGEVQAR